MTTANLFAPQDVQPSPFASMPLSGAGFDETRDRVRLIRQIDCIVAVVIAGDWWTIQKLVAVLRRRYSDVGFPENSVQAQLRNLRKEGYDVERRHIANGLFEYRVAELVNPGVGQALRGRAVAA